MVSDDVWGVTDTRVPLPSSSSHRCRADTRGETRTYGDLPQRFQGIEPPTCPLSRQRMAPNRPEGRTPDFGAESAAVDLPEAVWTYSVAGFGCVVWARLFV